MDSACRPCGPGPNSGLLPAGARSTRQGRSVFRGLCRVFLCRLCHRPALFPDGIDRGLSVFQAVVGAGDTKGTNSPHRVLYS